MLLVATLLETPVLSVIVSDVVHVSPPALQEKVLPPLLQ
jgi:hypothetical protein